MPEPMGRRRWAIAEGYIPGWSHGPEPQMLSHEAVCLLNTSDEDAHVTHHDLFRGSRASRTLPRPRSSAADQITSASII